ncbi:zygote arrest 1-like protein [Willisornis vidua]|uniref:Zygote arrest 1-like protein n=1 Tax=Willisornis vidua TaxID=1566151 RepID=A0ABQ9D2A1_9PASS|nr:zygote arrest 1-like protein [Willisornis vidua]
MPDRSRSPAAKQPSWKQSKSGGISPFLGGPLTPLPPEYLDSYRRAYLQALLSQVYFKQLCRKCQKGFNPYRVEAIQCQICSKTRCSCPQKKRHIDLKRPHRQELCGRCKGKRLSCDSTYSFKYIV